MITEVQMKSTFENVVVVGGCGHVGLPLGIVLAESGLNVRLLDVDKTKIEIVNRGEMPFAEEGSESVLRQVVGAHLTATEDDQCLETADAVITVIGTPVDEHLNPTVKAIYQNIDRLLVCMKPDSLLVLRSTVYPGVTKLIYDRIQATSCRIHLAFCPERIAEGHAVRELRELPQIVSAFDPDAMYLAKVLFSRITQKLIELQPLEAELAKLFTNSWRYLNFAVSNQFYMLAQNYGLDFYRIRDAVTCDYPRMRSFAAAGFAAGPCLLKDTLQLAAFANNNFFLGHAAMLVNERMPNHIVQRAQSAINLSECTAAILGMAFKADSDDKRESLSYKLKHLLEVEAQEVLCSDPYVHDPRFVSTEEAVARADVIFLGVPHSCYAGLRIPAEKIVIDIWGFWKQQESAETEDPIAQVARGAR
jgi:UDP-N-acetyl-D-mannosaminuronic acid dehydrogenase